jgi:hypothetical protein
MFKRNVGLLDRIVRVGLGVVLLPAGLVLLGGLRSGVPGVLLAGLGVLGLVTGLTGFCPLYVPFGINTLEKEKELIARCRSMMAGFRQGSASSGDPSAVQMCGPCSPSLGKAHDQQEKTV